MQKITDVGDAQQLIRFAGAAHLTRLDEEHSISQSDVARAMGRKHSAFLSRFQRTGEITDEQLKRLDEVVVALVPNMPGAGSLSSLNIRLRGLAHRGALVAQVPCAWTWELLKNDPVTEFDVLTHASAILSIFMTLAKTRKRVDNSRAARELRRLVSGLILIGCSPPTARNTDALVILGSLARYFPETPDLIKEALESEPLNFRAWRAVTELVQLVKDEPNSVTLPIKNLAEDLLRNSEHLREKSIYPGRSLDAELAIVIPHKWNSPDGGDWGHAFLLSRAKDHRATIRERGTAAHGLWQRAFSDKNSRQAAENDLRELIAQFRVEAETSESAAGLRWLAETLGVVLEGSRFCNRWPPCSQPWFRAVKHAAEGLEEPGVPRILQPAMKVLFEHTILQNAGVTRRQAIDTLVTGGWTQPIVSALDSVLRSEDSESWLRSRALFALGFLQHRDSDVASILADACRSAYIKFTKHPTVALATELHAALFAVGDCFGAGFGAESGDSANQSIRRLREDVLSPFIRDTKIQDDKKTWPVARAAVYTLAFTAEDSRQSGGSSPRELLKLLSGHRDAVTRDFSNWALEFRFTEDGSVLSLRDAYSNALPRLGT